MLHRVPLMPLRLIVLTTLQGEQAPLSTTWEQTAPSPTTPDLYNPRPFWQANPEAAAADLATLRDLNSNLQGRIGPGSGWNVPASARASEDPVAQQARWALDDVGTGELDPELFDQLCGFQDLELVPVNKRRRQLSPLTVDAFGYFHFSSAGYGRWPTACSIDSSSRLQLDITLAMSTMTPFSP